MGAEAMVIGTGIQAYANYSAAQSKADALVEQANMRTLQAAQARDATVRDIELTRRRGDKILGAQISAVGRSGTTLSGSNLLTLEDTAANIMDELSAIEKAGGYKQFVYGKESEYDITAAGETRTAGTLSAIGSAFSLFSKNPNSYDAKKIP